MGTLKKAAEAIQSLEIIVYPTDTLYGLGALACSKKSVRRLRKIKGKHTAPISVVVSSIGMLKKYAHVSAKEMKIAKKAFPGKYTLLLTPKKPLEHLEYRGKVGFRIPGNKFCTSLARKTGPITATSANKSGKNAYTIRGIKSQLKDDVSVYIDVGPLRSKGSTVYDPGTGRVIRKGEGTIKNIV